MTKEQVQTRLTALRQLMRQEEVEAVYLHGRYNTRYFSGFSGTTSEVLVTANEAIIYVDGRYTQQAKTQCLGYEVIEPEKGGLLQNLLGHCETLGLQTLAIEDEVLPVNLYHYIQKTLSQVTVKRLSSQIDRLRWVKDEEELGYIREAVRIADEAYEWLLPQIKAGMTEMEVVALLEYRMKCLGAEGPSFDIICASGKRSAMPHGVASRKVIESGDFVTLDFGCLYNGYCSDVTRNFFVGRRNEKMQEIYETVLDSHLTAERGTKAGMTGAQSDQLARAVIEKAGYGAYFTHSLGHSLGLEIHESPRLSKASDDVLLAGSLVTIEPGIYIPDLGGCRIEDTCIVREDGLEVLTQCVKEAVLVDPV